MADNAVLTKQDLPEIIKRYRAGESMLNIAKDSTVKARQLYNWLLDELGPDYEKIQTECLINRIADADQRLEESSDALQVSRAREIARYARMDFERRRPHLYGPKQEIKQDTSVTVIVQMVAPEPFTINAQADTTTACGSDLIEKP